MIIATAHDQIQLLESLAWPNDKLASAESLYLQIDHC
jgi:hypothetical protein